MMAFEHISEVVHEKNVDPAQVPPAAIQPSDQKKENKQQIDALLLAYWLIFQSVLTDHETAQIQAKGIEANVSAQNKMIAQEADLNFNTAFQDQVKYTIKNEVDKHQLWEFNGRSWILNTWTTTKIVRTRVQISNTARQKIVDANNKLQLQNQEISAVRGVLQDQLTVLRQSSQIKQTNLNSSIDESQQAMQQGSSLLQMLTQLTNQITRI